MTRQLHHVELAVERGLGEALAPRCRVREQLRELE